MTLSCRSLIAVAATALLFPAASFGDDWVGPSTGGEFNVAAHWDTGSAPGEDVISNVIGDVVVERSDDTTTGVVIVNQGATLNVTGGTHADTKSGRRNRNVVGGEGTGTVNQSGGSLNIRHMLVVGRGKNNDGTYRLTGGDLKITRSGLSFLAGKKRKGTSLEIGVSGARGHVLVSGGTLITRSGLGVGSGGVFEVSGSGAKSIGIGSHHTSDGAYYQRSGGVLRVGLDAMGVTPLFVDEIDGDPAKGDNGDVTFDSGAVLEPYDAGGAAANQWTTVMHWEGELNDQGLTLSGGSASAGWEMRIQDKMLQVRQMAFAEPE